MYEVKTVGSNRRVIRPMGRRMVMMPIKKGGSTELLLSPSLGTTMSLGSGLGLEGISNGLQGMNRLPMPKPPQIPQSLKGLSEKLQNLHIKKPVGIKKKNISVQF